ncbi:MAG TPA: hypothetical protein EYP62_07450 [Kiritimatiellae bacterium]|nr:hypothetical protein [Kiritimatiellia bacterium]
MQMDRLTIRAQEALRDAQRYASERGHSEVDVEHVLLALLRQKEGIVPAILARAGVSPEAVASEVETTLGRRPRVEGAAVEVYVSRRLKQVLDQAFELAHRMKDQFVSTEHLLLALLEQGIAILIL